VSLYEGVAHILHPVAITDARINYIVLGISLVFEGGSWLVAWREFRPAASDIGYIEAATRSKDPTSFMVLFEDTAALIGILIALAGTFAAEQFDAPVVDGVASIGIALLLAATGAFLARESKGLLMGEPASKATGEIIRRIARDHPDIVSTQDLLTIHLAPRQILVALTLHLAEESSAADIEREFSRLEATIRHNCPDVVALFMKPRLRAEIGEAHPSLQQARRTISSVNPGDNRYAR
jgi:divalent metal cation (Fe/Co/Zn/Cd) transporter